MKKHLTQELGRQNERVARFADQIRILENKTHRQNQDLSLTVSHVDSHEAKFMNASGPLSSQASKAKYLNNTTFFGDVNMTGL